MATSPMRTGGTFKIIIIYFLKKLYITLADGIGLSPDL